MPAPGSDSTLFSFTAYPDAMRKFLISLFMLCSLLRGAQNMTLIPNGSGTGTINTPGITYYNYVAGVTVDFTGVRLIGISGGGGGGGNVVGPGSSAVGDIPTFGNTAGTSIVDGGVWSINPSGNVLTGTYATFNATTSAILLQTSTPSTSGNPKWSPAMTWRGSYFSSGSSKVSLWRAEDQTQWTTGSLAANGLVFGGIDNGGSEVTAGVFMESNGGGFYSPALFSPSLQNLDGNVQILAGAVPGITITQTTDLIQFNQYTTAGILENDTSGNVTSALWKFVSSGNVLQTSGGAQIQDVSGTGALAFVANGSNNGLLFQAQTGGSIVEKIASTTYSTLTLSAFALQVPLVQIIAGTTINELGYDSTHYLYWEFVNGGNATIGTFGQNNSITFAASGYTFSTTSVTPAFVIAANGDVTAGNGSDTGAPLGVNGNFIATGTIATGGGSGFKITAVNSVSPTSPNRTLTLTYNGTAYYVAAKTTDD